MTKRLVSHRLWYAVISRRETLYSRLDFEWERSEAHEFQSQRRVLLWHLLAVVEVSPLVAGVLIGKLVW